MLYIYRGKLNPVGKEQHYSSPTHCSTSQELEPESGNSGQCQSAHYEGIKSNAKM